MDLGIRHDPNGYYVADLHTPEGECTDQVGGLLPTLKVAKKELEKARELLSRGYSKFGISRMIR